LIGVDEQIFLSCLFRFVHLVELGEWEKAGTLWELLGRLGRNWSREAYRAGTAEYWYGRFRIYQGDLSDAHLNAAEQEVRKGKNRTVLGYIHYWRGILRLERDEWELAAESCDLNHNFAVWQGYGLIGDQQRPSPGAIGFYFAIPRTSRASRTAKLMVFHSLQDPAGRRSTILFTEG
jgi:hypothetical protein